MFLPGVAILCVLCLLSACGNNAIADDVRLSLASVPAAAPARGVLVAPPLLQSTMSATPLPMQRQVNLSVTGRVLGRIGALDCDVSAYRIQYGSVGARGEAILASAALMVPGGRGAACSGPRPMLLYAHGTSTDRDFNIADLGEGRNAEGLIVATFFVARGYIVVAPDYAGLGASTLPYHPYLNADQSSRDMMDALAAARSALPTLAAAISDDDRLYLTGYSQGAHVALATQRALQAAGMTVTAAAPMSGPYALASFLDAIYAGQVNSGATVHMTLLMTSYQRAYGDVYARPAVAYDAAYVDGIETLLPSTQPRSALYAAGRLPHYALFSSTPPPGFAAQTPAAQPAAYSAQFARAFGARPLIANSYRLAYLQDMSAHPDAATARHPLRRAAHRNDLRGFRPTAPTLLCGGAGDPTVYWFNSQLLAGDGVTLLDLDSPAAGDDPHASLKRAFSAAKALVAAAAVARGADDGGAAAVLDAYHSTLVPPFCLAAVRDFFVAHERDQRVAGTAAGPPQRR